MKKNTEYMAVLACACFLAVSGCKSGDVEALPPDDSPVVHSSISPKPAKGCGSPFYSVHYSSAYKTLREAEEYKAGARDYYVRELNDNRNEYLLAGISASERKDWFESHKIAEKDQPCMNVIFDEIGAAAKRTLPKFRPLNYSHHDSTEEGLIREAVKKEIPDGQVIGIGVLSPTWEIDKLNNGTPRSRYKYGMAWVKSPSFDDGYCRIFYANIVQDYSGGGTYADSQANYISITPAGCK